MISKLGLNTPESSALMNGFAYKLGLAALIKLAESAKLKLAAVGNDTRAFEFALKAARAKHSFAPADCVFGEPETK